MKPLALAALLVVAACTSQRRTADYAAAAPGAILSVDAIGADVAARSIEQVQAALLAHPAWASQTLSHGIEPPDGSFVKVKGRCASLPAAATDIGRMMAGVAHGTVRCGDVPG